MTVKLFLSTSGEAYSESTSSEDYSEPTSIEAYSNSILVAIIVCQPLMTLMVKSMSSEAYSKSTSSVGL